MKDEFVSTEHLLLALTKVDSKAKNILKLNAITEADLLKVLQNVRGSTRVTDQTPEGKYQALERYGIDLVERARQGKLDPVIGRDQEIRRVMQVLSRRTKNNPVLIGEPGVGKTAIAEGLALRIVEADVPEVAEKPPRHRPGHGRPGGRHQVPRRVRGAAQGRAPRSVRRRQRDPLHRRVAHRGRRGPGRRGQRRGQSVEARAGPRRAALHRRHDAGRVSQVRREGRRPGAPLPAGVRGRAVGRGHDRHPPRTEAPLRGPSSRRADQGLGPGGGGEPLAPLHRRPLPARQGHRPDGRGHQPAGDGAGKRAHRDRPGAAASGAARTGRPAVGRGDRGARQAASRRGAGGDGRAAQKAGRPPRSNGNWKRAAWATPRKSASA